MSDATSRPAKGQLPRTHDGNGIVFLRHLVTAVVTGVLIFGFWSTRMQWTADMRLWRAVGDAAIVLLFAALALGPAAKLSVRAGKALSWRRPLGIWAALAALTHTILIIDGWTQWSIQRFLGFEFVPQLGREARLEPGFGLANLIGLVAVIWMTLLLATSSDRAVRYLGPAAWKWVQNGAYIVFSLSVLHSAYFLFLHYTASFHRAVPDPNWFRFPLLALGAIVAALQWGAFARSVRQHRARRTSVIASS